MKIIKLEKGLFNIEVDGNIIGGGSIDQDESGTYLERIDIEEEYQGQGHGTKALYEIAQVYGDYYLAPDNEDAQRLYEKVAEPMSQENYDSFGFAIDQGFGVYEI